MKVTSRFTVRAALALAAAGVVGGFGACKDSVDPNPPPPPPPPPAAIPAPTNLTATAVSATRINLAWAETATNETGFRIDRCAGAACTNFAQIGTGEANAVAFADSVGLTASTQYSYRVAAFNATDTSAFTATVTATTLAGTTTPGFVMVGAGEITSCNIGKSTQTAALVDSVIAKNPDAIVFTAGSNVMDTTAGAVYADCFNNSGWAKFLPRMRAAVGQRDFMIGSANGANGNGVNQVYGFFGEKAGAPNGWYHFDVGTKWRVFVLNSSTWQHGATNLTDAGSPQNTWLATELAATTQPCVMAIVNLRRFYSYGEGTNFNVRPIWSALYNAGADVVISANDKSYERWVPQTHEGVKDEARGIRQFIVGTGGRTLDGFAVKPMDQVPNLEVRDRSVNGVLKLTLNDNSYSWEFMPVITGGFTDTGTANCH
jgi:acid phosphatase type 7